MVDQQIVDQQQFIHNFRDNSNNNNYIKQQQFLRGMVGGEGGAIRTPVYMNIC